ncbi:MAG: hypothetical protein Sapg2KO_12130 [Saprospiraceae bacterium]
MKTLHFFAFLIIFSTNCQAQVSLSKLALPKGIYPVGFQHYTTIDSTRTYSRIFDWDRQSQFRPMEISIWYPAGAPATLDTTMTVLDYLEVYKQEMEWAHLPNNQILNWFFNGNIPKDIAHLSESTRAYKEIKKASGTFPVLVYAPGLEGSSIENFALFESLASQGYIIIASPSRGADNRYFARNKLKNIETQAQDITFLIKEVQKIKQTDPYKIAAIGYSFGGMSTILSQMKNQQLKAILSLDGAMKYQYSAIQQSVFFDLDRMDVPFIHFAQKNIPDSVLQADKLDASLNTDFDFYEELKWSAAYRLQFHDLTHPYFTTLGLFFQQRDPRQDKTDPDLLAAHRLLANYCYHFSEAYLKKNPKSLAWLQENPDQQKQKQGRLDFKKKSALKKPIQFNDFHELARAAEYQNLVRLYQQLKNENPALTLPEYQLNNLGLQLTFNPKTSEAGIKIFNLALQLYPKSANLFDSLAEAHLYLGNKEEAIRSFEQSLALNPENRNAIERLKTLKVD